MKTIYLIYRGQGMDSGFGDYTSSWDNTPMKLNGQILWFNSKDVARSVVERLNKQSSEEFYRAGFGDSYDGNFPVEYETREIIIPENAPSDLFSFEKILNQEFDSWSWFSAVRPEYDVDEEVKNHYSHLNECSECKDFGFLDKDFNKTKNVCTSCEISESKRFLIVCDKCDASYFEDEGGCVLCNKDIGYITCPECFGSGDDDEYDEVCVLCNGEGVFKDD